MTPDPNKREAMLPVYQWPNSPVPESIQERMMPLIKAVSSEHGKACGQKGLLSVPELDFEMARAISGAAVLGFREGAKTGGQTEQEKNWIGDTRAPERDAEVAVMNCAFDPELVEFTPAEWLALNTQKADRITELERELASVTLEKEAETKAVLHCTRAMRLMQDEIASVTAERDALKLAIEQMKPFYEIGIKAFNK